MFTLAAKPEDFSEGKGGPKEQKRKKKIEANRGYFIKYLPNERSQQKSSIDNNLTKFTGWMIAPFSEQLQLGFTPRVRTQFISKRLNKARSQTAAKLQKLI